MSSEPKKIVNLDRPREAVVDEQHPDNPTDFPARNDVDRLLSDFLEQLNSISAEYESAEENVVQPEQPNPDPAGAPVAETIANMAAALQQQTAPAVPVESQQEPVPQSVSADAATLDEEIERALSALEELPARREEPHPEVALVLERVSEAEPAVPLAAGPGPEQSLAPVISKAPADATEVPAAAATTVSAPPVAPAKQEASQPLFTYAPQMVGRGKIMIGFAIAAAVALLALALYFATSRSQPEAPVDEAIQPVAPPAQPAESSLQPAPVASQPQGVERVASGAEPHSPKQAATNTVKTRPAGSQPDTEASRMESKAPSRTEGPEPPRPVSAASTVEQPVARPSETPQAPLPQVPGSAAPAMDLPVSSLPPQPVSSSPVPPPRTSDSIAGSTVPGLSTTPATSKVQPAPAIPALPRASESTPARTPPPPPARTVENATPAELISKVLPTFPDFARRMNQTGRVDLEIQIDAQGRVTKATPVSGAGIFHPAAVEAVRQWRFKPATLNGERVPSQGKVTVVFDKR